jgi:uncharacterized cupin superfamily protein
MSDNDPSERPPFIKHWRDVAELDDASYPGSDELLAIFAPLGQKTGLERIGVYHVRLPPGRRTSWPHAECDEEEFVYVIEGCPIVWIDGVVHALYPGTGVGFPAGTGIAHSFINDTESDVVLLVVGEASRAGHRIHYPLHPSRNREIGARHWYDVPRRPLGPHDGLPRAVRELLAREPGAALAIHFMQRRYHVLTDAVYPNGVEVSDDDLAALARLPRLERLSLDTTNVTDDQLRLVGALPRLKSLDLSGTSVTDAGLAQLEALQSLEHLRIKETKLGDAGLAFIADAFPCLETLQIRDTAISGSGLVRLARLRKLEMVVLSRDHLPAECITELTRALPRCEVVS